MITQFPYLRLVAIYFSMFALLSLFMGCVSIESAMTESPTPTVAVQAADHQEMGDDGPRLADAIATINVPSLRLHPQPNEDSAVIGGLNQGEQYKVIGISSKGRWLRLEVLDARNGAGWVDASFVTVKGDITDVPTTDGTGEALSRPTPAPGGVVVQTDGTRLRVRSEPNTDAEILTYIYDGEAYQILAVTEDEAWMRLDLPGISGGGWVAAEFLQTNGEDQALVVEITESARAETSIETDNSETADTEGSAEDASTPASNTTDDDTVVEQEVSSSNSDESTSDDATETELDIPEPIPGSAIVFTDGTRLRVRSAPSTDAAIIGYVFNGDVFPVLERSVDGTWVQLDIPDLVDGGWVADIYVITE